MKTIYFFIKFVLLTVVFALFSITTLAQDISIVDVRRNITLSDDDIIYKDFYLNAGDLTALKKNLVVNVKRKVLVRDMTSKSIGDFETVVGQLKIIQVGQKVSVAREYKLISRDEEAMVEQIGIMSGDRIDLEGSFIDTSKPAKKVKTAEVEAPVDTADETVVETMTADTGAVINLTPAATPQVAPSPPPRDPAAQSKVGALPEPTVEAPKIQ